MLEIIPAILTDNPVAFQTQLSHVIGRTTWVHVDIMDGTLVPSKTIPIHLLSATPKELSLEVHLMVAQPERYFELCAIIGAKRVIVHAAALKAIDGVQSLAQLHGFELVVAINPDQQLEDAMLIAAQVTAVQLMAVMPGAQGQEFIPITLERIKTLHAALPQKPIAVDGGLTLQTIEDVVRAGAQRLVIGSAIMHATDPIAALTQFQERAAALETGENT